MVKDRPQPESAANFRSATRLRWLPWFNPLAILIVAMVILLVVACGSTSSQNIQTTTQATIPSITITAVDFAFKQATTIPPGLVDIKFMNNGALPHQVQFARIIHGTYDNFKAVLLKQGPAAFKLVSFYGGDNTIDPGHSEDVILDLPSGQYASICFVEDADGVPHYMKGMISSFNVSGSPSNASVPQASGEVVLKNFSFVLPGNIPSGPVTLKVTNQGDQPHEIAIVKLAPGKNLQDVLNFLQKPAGPPPFANAGGLGAIATGTSQWFKLNLQPGQYAALCFVPDPASGKAHYMLGMETQFSVH
jgi:hypothetical protein